MLQRLKEKGEDAKKIGIMVASHNEDTVRFAIEKMKEIGISPEDKVICFGQLLGMCDYITMPLGEKLSVDLLLIFECNIYVKISFFFQVKPDILHTNTSHMDLFMKFCHIYRGELKRTRVF